MKKVITQSVGFYLNTLSLISTKKAGRKGFELFCYPFRTPMKDKQKAYLGSAKSHIIHHNGNEVQAYRWGEGDKNILFLHGWQSHSYRWKPYIESFDHNEYTIWAFDAPGHGMSSGSFLSVPLYDEIILRMFDHIKHVEAIVSHSLGGFTAFYTNHKEGGLPSERLVALAPPGEAVEFFEFYKNTLNISDRTLQATINHFKQKYTHGPEYFSAPAFAKSMKIPGLIVHDEEDLDTSVENSKRLHQEWKDSSLIITKGYGHNLRSDKVIQTVTEYIGSQELNPAGLSLK